MENTDTDLAWAAGLIDGEGYVGVKKVLNHRQNYISQCWVSVAMTHFAAVERLHEMFGVGSVFETLRPKNPLHKPQKRWTAVSRHAYYVAKQIAPYAVVKRIELFSIIAHYEHGEKPKINRPGVVGEGNGFAKLSNEQVVQIRNLRGAMSQQKIADLFGVSQTLISAILRGARWTHIPD